MLSVNYSTYLFHRHLCSHITALYNKFCIIIIIIITIKVNE